MITKFAKEYPLERYSIKQFYGKYYQEYIYSWDELTTWPKDLRERLKEEVPFSRLTIVSRNESIDRSTTKILFKTENNNYIESVLIRDRKRNTVCVSCMSGCPVGCIFCATGQMGLNEALDEHSIIDQILYFARELKAKEEKVTNIVYMGMGEPMLNLESVARSIEILTDQEKFGISRRKITVSTSGYIEMLNRFVDLDLGVKIAISLHAPNQMIREKIMPTVAKSNRLEDLLDALDNFTKKTNKRVTYEYLLLKGINDSEENAIELAELLKNNLALVNLIEYNENDLADIKRSPNTKIFQKILIKNGITCTVRNSYGEEIKGACGQLGALAE